MVNINYKRRASCTHIIEKKFCILSSDIEKKNLKEMENKKNKCDLFLENIKKNVSNIKKDNIYFKNKL